MTMVSPTPSIHNPEPTAMDDVIIIGGSFAGLAAALQLGRARRKVTVLDTHLPRNRFVDYSHGLLGHDHKPPLEILAEARQQLARYSTIKLVNVRADRIFGTIDDFNVITSDGESFGARRLILSHGLDESLGLATVDTPLGIVLKVDERHETSAPGIYAAGDLANPLMPSVTAESSHGAMAGIFAQ